MEENKEQIFRNCQKIVKELLDQRGYNSENIKINPKIESYDIKVIDRTNKKKVALIYFETSLKYTKDDLKKTIIKISKYQQNNPEDKLKVLIIILSVSKSRLEEYKKQFIEEYLPIFGINSIELWDANNLQFNVTKHIDVPKHEIMTEEEVQNELPDVSKSVMKQIRQTDPQCLFIGAVRGQVIRIHRKTITSGIIFDYRVVI